LDFVRSGFPHLRSLKLRLTGDLKLGEIISYRSLHQALSKPGIITKLELKVKRITLLEKSLLEDYQALGIEGNSIQRVLGIVQTQYGIEIKLSWESLKMMVFYIKG
jgi:hypothetical protein